MKNSKKQFNTAYSNSDSTIQHKKDEWPPNSPDLNPLDYHVWGAMLERYTVFTPKPTNKAELKTVLEAIWEDLPQESIDLAVLAFRKRLQACIRADGGHFEQLLKQNRQHQKTALFRAKNQFKKKSAFVE